jgi:hypothetical protein
MLSAPRELTAEPAARLRLRELVSLAETLRDSLLATHASLPVSPREDVMLLGEEDPDFFTEARRTIDCALADHLDPLIQALRMTAEYKPESERSERR